MEEEEEEVEEEEEEKLLRYVNFGAVTAGKIGRTLSDRPKPTVGCSANGKRRRMANNFSRRGGVI